MSSFVPSVILSMCTKFHDFIAKGTITTGKVLGSNLLDSLSLLPEPSSQVDLSAHCCINHSHLSGAFMENFITKYTVTLNYA